MNPTPNPDEAAPEFTQSDGIRLLEKTAAGHRSLWFKAEQVRLERQIALKFLRPSLGGSEFFTELFIEAGRQASVIIHPSALPIINVYPKQHCIAVQWCRGISLRDRGQPLSAADAALVGVTVMDCLSFLHATGRCHGNLTPGNVFLDDDGGVWLDDFFQPPIMMDGDSCFRGDNRFVAPEVPRSGVPDWRCDVFSLGCIMYDSLAGGKCSRELLDALELMRALDPDRRGASPEAVLDNLRRVKQIEDIRLGREPQTRRKRMYRRVPGEFDVELRRRSATPEETAVLLNKIRDIGESGVFVETEDELLTIGSILELDFTLKGIDGNVHAFGVVRWKSIPPMPQGVGVQFLEVDQEGLARLRRFLDNK